MRHAIRKSQNLHETRIKKQANIHETRHITLCLQLHNLRSKAVLLPIMMGKNETMSKFNKLLKEARMMCISRMLRGPVSCLSLHVQGPTALMWTERQSW
jgi:hypothetical protein